jgi:nicotinate phosphoribosyltransferase
MVYKLVCFDSRPVMKLSEGKMSLPGTKQIFRRHDGNGILSGDIIGLHEDAGPVDSAPLLEEVMAGGVRTTSSPTLAELRETFRSEFARLDTRYKDLRQPPHFPVSVSPSLQRMTAEVREDAVLTNVSGEGP